MAKAEATIKSDDDDDNELKNELHIDDFEVDVFRQSNNGKIFDDQYKNTKRGRMNVPLVNSKEIFLETIDELNLK